MRSSKRMVDGKDGRNSSILCISYQSLTVEERHERGMSEVLIGRHRQIDRVLLR